MGKAEEAAIGYLEQSINYARIGEALIATVTLLAPIVDMVAHVAEIDSDMAPEVGVAIEHLAEAGAALQRAHSVALLRLQISRGHLSDDDQRGGS